MRRQFVLVGGAVNVAYVSVFKIENVDVAAPPGVIIQIWKIVLAGAPNLSFESDGKIIFDAPQGFQIPIDLIAIGTGCIEGIYVADLFMKVLSHSSRIR